MVRRLINYQVPIFTLFLFVMILIGLISGAVFPTTVFASDLKELVPLDFSSSLSYPTIAVETVSTLTYQITNNNTEEITAVSLETNLPAGVTLMTPVNVNSSCYQVSVSASDGGSTVLINSDFIERGQSCTVRFDITSSSPGSHEIIIGELTSSAGSTGTGSQILTVNATYATLLMAFSPNDVLINQVTRLTYTFQNISLGLFETATLTNNLPDGMVIADFPDLTSNCNANFTAEPLSTTISMGPANNFSNCSASINVKIIDVQPQYINEASLMVYTVPSYSVKATAELGLFSEDEILFSINQDSYWTRPGETLDFTYQITNFDRYNFLTSLQFEHDFETILPGVTFLDLPLTDVCGTGFSLSSDQPGKISFQDGSLLPGETCQIPLSIEIPDSVNSGVYEIITTGIQGEKDGSVVNDVGAILSFYVEDAPLFSKQFSAEFQPIFSGDTIHLTYKIENTSDSYSITDGQFIDDFLSVFDFAFDVINMPSDGFCGVGSTVAEYRNPAGPVNELMFIGLSVPPSQFCEFSVDINIVNPIIGNYISTTGYLSYTINGENLLTDPASAEIFIEEKPLVIERSFMNDEILPGDIIEMVYSITNDSDNSETQPLNATAITFADNLSMIFSGIVVSNIPETGNICGVGSLLNGVDSIISFTGGALNAGESCSFSVMIQIPQDIAPGQYTSSSLPVVDYIVNERPLSDVMTSESLVVGGISFDLSMDQTTLFPGDMVDLHFSLGNQSEYPLTTGSFHFTPSDWIPNLVVTNLPLNGFCGGSSVINNSGGIYFFNGLSIDRLSSCEFSVTLNIPATTEPDNYSTFVSGFSFLINGRMQNYIPQNLPLTITPVFDFSKEFSTEMIIPGEAINVHYTITNFHESLPLTSIHFTDDFNAALAGLTTVGLPQNDVCGVGSSISGALILSFSGGTLLPQTECSFDVVLQVPGTFQSFQAVVESYSSVISADLDGESITAPAAFDQFWISYNLIFDFSKEFLTGTIMPGESINVRYTIKNYHETLPLTRINFTDDFDAALTDLTVVGLPQDDVCGVGSSISGASILSFSGGTLPPQTECSFDVVLQVPETIGMSQAVVESYSSVINAELEGESITAPAAFDQFGITYITVNVSALPITAPRHITSLTFLIQDPGENDVLFGLEYDLSGIFPGASFEVNEPDGVCGLNSTLVGGNQLVLSDATLSSGENCDFSVDIYIPSTLSPGFYDLPYPEIRYGENAYQPDGIGGFLQVLYGYYFPVFFNFAP